MKAKGEHVPFANFFSDDTATDLSIYYPSMHDHIHGQALASTLTPRRKLKRLLILVRSFLFPVLPIPLTLSPRACS
jgi:hypothetical protein